MKKKSLSVITTLFVLLIGICLFQPVKKAEAILSSSTLALADCIATCYADGAQVPAAVRQSFLKSCYANPAP